MLRPVYLIFLLMGLTSLALAQELTLFPQVVIKGNPYISGITQTGDGNYLVTGFFDHINGMPTGNLVKIDANGNQINSFNRIFTDDHILKIIELDNGKILVGGWFKSINGEAASVIRLNADGTIDGTFQKFILTDSYGYVSTLDLQSDGKIIVVGSFSVSGYENLIRLNSDGTPDNSFIHLDAPYGYFTNVLVHDNDAIFISDSQNLFNLDSNGGALNGFPISINSGGSFYFMKKYNDKLIIGGDFISVAGVSRKNVAVISDDGTVDNFNIPNVPYVNSMDVTNDGKIIISDLNNLTVYNSNGAQDPILTGTHPGRVFVDKSQRIFISGGGNMTFNGLSHPYLIHINNDLTVDNSFTCQPTSSSGINEIASHTDGRILIAGGDLFAGANTLNKKLVQINADGTLDTSFNPNVSSRHIPSIAIQPNEKILVCSDNLVRLTKSGEKDETFNEAVVTAGSNEFSRVKIKNDRIFLSGDFNKINNYNSPGIVSLTENGTVYNSFASGIPQNSHVTNFAFQSDNKIIVAGYFDLNSEVKSVIRLNEDGTLDNSFHLGSHLFGDIMRIVIDSQNRIYLGGTFAYYEGTSLNRLVRLSKDGELDLSFVPDLSFSSNPNSLNEGVRGLELLSDEEIVTGATVMGYGNNSVAVKVYDGMGNTIESPFSHFDGSAAISCSYYDGETLYLAGNFVSAGQNAISGIASLPIHTVAGDIINLQAAHETPKASNLNWVNNILHGSLLIIERSANNNTSFVPVDTIAVTATSYRDTGVTGNVEYYYRIKAINTNSSTGYFGEAYLSPLQNQTINFDPLESVTYGDPDFTLNATASSGLLVTFTSSDAEIASIQDNTVTIHKAGTVIITATQAGNAQYDSATPVDRTFMVNKADQEITFDPVPEKESNDGPFEVSASASSGLPVQIISSDESIASANGLIITIHKGGEVVLTATQSGNENYNAASAVMQSLTINLVTANEKEITNTLRVYPNPSNGLFQVTSPASLYGSNCFVVSPEGVMQKHQFVVLNKDVIELDLTSRESGLYLIILENGDRKINFKVIKQ